MQSRRCWAGSASERGFAARRSKTHGFFSRLRPASAAHLPRPVHQTAVLMLLYTGASTGGPMPTVPVTVRIPDEVNDQLEKLAKATARSKSWLAAEAIGAYVASESSFIAAVEEGRKAARAGDVVPFADVRRWLES